ncbi:MAG: CoA pyrophosphatase [Thermovirga sp.]
MVYDPQLLLSVFTDGDPKIAWDSIPGSSTRQSAVLVPFFAREDGLHILVVERSDTLRRHPGQIAFPGGAREPGDLGPVQTALREFEEETGISSQRVDILALLREEHAYSSDFTLFPVVGFVNGDISIMDLSPDPVEVRRLIEIPFGDLCGPPLMEGFVSKGEEFQYPVFLIDGGVRIWGATAWVIRRVIRIIEAGSGRQECL